ncbi:winged helix-turn-helix transcriptional regulator [Candidatus Bathyarchaeota archaeon]|nr:winged helix-turn-helix transcriptional regulator [Candidatus Bathyarchaeota archaeon]
MQPALKRAIIAFALASIIIVSFAAVLQQQRNFQEVTPNPYYLLVLPTSFVNFGANDQTTFNNGTRTQIYNYIDNNPGIQFRGVCAGLSIQVGLAQYHLGVLIKADLVSFIRDGRYKRFFPAKKFSRKEMLTISLLRHKTARKILEALLDKKQLSHGELAGRVSITSQALTWQMKRIGKTQFILQTNEGLKTIYSLDENSTPTLTKYLALAEEKQ